MLPHSNSDGATEGEEMTMPTEGGLVEEGALTGEPLPAEEDVVDEGPVIDGINVDGEEEIVLPEKPQVVPQAALIKLTDIELLDNPRGDIGDVSELAESIRVGGLLHPVVVRQAPAGSERPYQLVVGYRRYQAHLDLERTEIPATIHQANDAEILADLLTENLQRSGWSAMAEAHAMQRMIDVLDYSRSKVAATLGVHRSQVTKRLALLQLPEKVRHMVEDESITASHAEVLMGLHNQDSQEEMAELAARSGASVDKLSSWASKVREQEVEEEVHKEIEEEALLDQDTPIEDTPTPPITPMPAMILAEWDEEDQLRATVYMMLRAGNDREVIDYLQDEQGIEIDGYWGFLQDQSVEDLQEMQTVLLHRWYRAPHRYATFPQGLRVDLGAGEERRPARERAPQWEIDDDFEADWEEDWTDDDDINDDNIVEDDE